MESKGSLDLAVPFTLIPSQMPYKPMLPSPLGLALIPRIRSLLSYKHENCPSPHLSLKLFSDNTCTLEVSTLKSHPYIQVSLTMNIFSVVMCVTPHCNYL